MEYIKLVKLPSRQFSSVAPKERNCITVLKKLWGVSTVSYCFLQFPKANKP